MLAKVLILLAACSLVLADEDCVGCKQKYKGKCNFGNSPTTCDDANGCYRYSWRNNQWQVYNYPPPNCNDCLQNRKGSNCEDASKTCNFANGDKLHWNCDKNENCQWDKTLAPNRCN